MNNSSHCGETVGDSCITASSYSKSKIGGLGLRLGIGLIIVAQSMIFGLALNLHDDVPHSVRWFVQNLILCGTLTVAVLLGGPLVQAAWQATRHGRLTIEALFLLTMIGAMIASLQSHIVGRGHIYFEVISVLLVVYTFGKLIGARSRASAIAKSQVWGDRLDTCRVIDEVGLTRVASVAEVQPGDVVEVYPGEMIAVDGIIRDGVGFVTETAMSGEPFAVVRRPGDCVLAGSASADATFRITSSVPGTARQVDRILAMVEAARDKSLSLQARADAVACWFLPFVAVTAVGTFAYWTFIAEEVWEVGLFNAMAVLLVACPCVIGLATPVVIWSALSRLAERGVIVRSGDVIERLATVDRVMFDKTGTLTEDRFVLVDIETSATVDDRAKLLGWLSLVQSQCHHPVARPFAELPRPFAPGEEPRVHALTTVPGCGVIATITEANGTQHSIQIGTPSWLSSCRTIPPLIVPGSHCLFITLDSEVAAVATVTERLRVSTPQVIAHFKLLDLPVEILTGDAPGRAEALGLPDTLASMLPDDKRAAVEGTKALFVGDGINDASALALAHCGVALASGADLAVNAAMVTLYGDDLRVLPWAVELSRDAVRAVRRNLFRALCYNVAGMTLAACGLLHPVFAAILMVISSLTLIFSSTRVGYYVEARRDRKPFLARTISEFPPTARKTVIHAMAFTFQAFVFVLLITSMRDLWFAVIFIGGFALTGTTFAMAWRRFPVPHWADMCFGMLTLGNLGMLLGWWADIGFAALHDGGCCACIETMRGGVMKPWMWVGMLVFANVAMRWLPRTPMPSGCHSLAMFTGGNAGMIAGMVAGGWCVTQVPTASMIAAVALSFAGMTLGMLAGMLAGTWFAERMLAGLRVLGFMPKWWSVNSARTS